MINYKDTVKYLGFFLNDNQLMANSLDTQNVINFYI